jgi:hypothetical protein
MTNPADPAVLEPPGDEGELTDPDAPVAAVPPELVLDEVARLRLERTLAASADDVVGVVALPGEIPPGSSARTAAERAAMRPAGDVAAHEPGEVHGAVVLRAGVDHEIAATSVHVGRGQLLVDRGALAHDPWRPAGRLQVAVADGRPPFRWRPVVLLLGLEADLDLAETARALANGLLVRDVEARLAVPEVPDGSYLTRPCRPVIESVRALDPDVVVALDPTAADVASDWCDGNRSTTVVELTQDIAHDVQLVSWRIGAAHGRLRARVGRGVSATELAGLANRLCSGPQPMPPPRTPAARIGGAVERAVNIGRRPAPGRQQTVAESVLAIGPPPTAPAADHLNALLHEMGAAGSTIHRHSFDAIDPALLLSAPLVIVSSSAGEDAIRTIVEHRMGATKLTVVDVEPRDVIEPAGPDQPVQQRAGLDDPDQVLAASGLAVVSSLAIADALRRAGARAQVVPFLADRRQVAALGEAADERDPELAPTIGWRIGPVGPAPGPVATALADLVGRLVDEGVRVDVVAAPDAVPADLSARAGLSIRDHPPTPAQLAAWTAQIWTPPAGWVALSGDLRELVEAGLAGVPTVIGAAERPAIGGLADLDLVVDEVDRSSAWETVIRSLLRTDVRARRGARAREGCVAIHGPDATRLRIARLTGWLGATSSP